MPYCLSCNEEHDGTFASGKYCSRSCSNRRNIIDRISVNKSISNSLKNYYSKLSLEDKKRIYGISGHKISSLKQEKSKLERLNKTTEELKFSQRKRKVFEEQNNICLHCGISNWLGKNLTFELDHIDGNKHNNIRSNLRVLCPNCHSQTPTWRGRNDKKRKPGNYIKLDSSSDKAPT